MAANVGLIAHTTEGDADEFSAHGLGNRFAERGFPDSGRADEAQNRPAAFWLEFAHGQIFQNPPLHFFQIEMIAIENSLGVVDVDFVLRRSAPGQFAENLQVGANHAVFRRCRGDSFQPRQLAQRFFHHRLGRIGGLELLAQLIDLGGRAFVGFAQLFSNRLELFLQIEAPLALVDVLGDLLLNFRLQFEDVQLRGQARGHQAQAFFDVRLFQHRLLLGHVGLQIRREEIGKGRRRGDAVEHLRRLIGRIGRQLDHAIGLCSNRGQQRIQIRALGRFFFENFDSTEEKRLFLLQADQPESGQAVHDDRLIAIRQAKELEDAGNHTDLIKIGQIGIFCVGRFLGNHGDQLVAGHYFFQQCLALGAADVQRHHRAGEDDDVANRQDRQELGNLQPLSISASADDSSIVRSFNDLLLSHINLVGQSPWRPRQVGWATPARHPYFFGNSIHNIPLT